MSIQATPTTGQTGFRSGVAKHHSESCFLLSDLFKAYFEARKYKRNTRSQLKFEMNLEENLINLYRDIVERKYKVGRSMCFIVNRPVKREVFAASFRDRVVHHLIFHYLSPLFEPIFIYDSYSCRRGKGTLMGVERLEHHIRSCSKNYTETCYVLKLDISGYFMNIDRQMLFDCVMDTVRKRQKDLDMELIEYLCRLIICNDPTKGCYVKGNRSDWIGLPPSKSLFHTPEGIGLPIGNLTSQLFSNIFLSPLDDYIKRDMGFHHYGRYVDDFYLVHNSKEELLKAIPDIRNFLSSTLHLTLHPHKIYLQKASAGVKFLGANVKPYRRYLCTKSKRLMNVRIISLLTREENPYIILHTINSYLGYLGHFKSYKMVKSFVDKFSILFEHGYFVEQMGKNHRMIFKVHAYAS